MKRSLFLKVCCCLLAVCLLSGCAPKSPLLAHADDDTGLLKTGIDVTLRRFSGIKNAKGKELRFFSKTENPFQKIGDSLSDSSPLEGNMSYEVVSKDEEKGKIGLKLPFSKTFTVYSLYHYFPEDVAARNKVWQKELLTKVSAEVNLTFSGISTVYQSISGDWEKIVFHCNNVTELYGDLEEFEANIKVDSVLSEDKKLKKKTDRYILEGSGRDHVILALADGELLTEGMEGNYTVTHKIYTDWEKDKDVTVKEEYDQDGNLLSTTEE